MKNFKYIIVLTFSSMMLPGCVDLNTPPNDRIATATFWKTDQDATLGVNAVYSHIFETSNNVSATPPSISQAASHYASWDGMTDIGYTHLPQSPESFILQGQFDALNSRVYNDYTNLYVGIRAANAFLGHVDGIQTSNAALMNRYKGEVRTLRAYFYGRLAQLFGGVPLITKEISIDEGKSVTRASVGEIWDFVSTELSEAALQLPTTQTDKGRVTQGTALSLKARYMLHAGRFQDAADAALQVVNSNVFALYPTYKTLFTTPAENNKEIILDMQFIKGSLSNDIFSVLAPQSVGSSKSLFVPTKALVDTYQMTNGLNISAPGSGFNPTSPYANRDPRLNYSIFVPGDVLPNGNVFNPRPTSTTGDAVGSTFTVSPTGFNLKKYVNAEDLTTPTNTGINLILLRYAEVLLTYAESKTELNQMDASVYSAINLIRQRSDVNMPVIAAGKTQAELRAIIRQERVVELAFEGQHYFDIRRWNTAETVMPGKVYGITYTDTNGVLQTIEVPAWTNSWTNRNYLWPIPQIEMNINAGLGQNDGWK